MLRKMIKDARGRVLKRLFRRSSEDSTTVGNKGYTTYQLPKDEIQNQRRMERNMECIVKKIHYHEKSCLMQKNKGTKQNNKEAQ